MSRFEMNNFTRSVLSTLSAAALLVGCGMERSEDEPRSTGGGMVTATITFVGTTKHAKPIPAITGYKAGFVEIDGKPRTVYVLKCTGVDGVVSIDGIGAVQCGLGEAVANTVELRV